MLIALSIHLIWLIDVLL